MTGKGESPSKMAAEIVLLVLPVLLALAAGWDLASYTIPNALSLALAAGFAVFAFAAGLAPGEIGSHLLAGFIGLAAGFALFAPGYIGGGDAKLFAAAALWFGLHDLLSYALVASIVGGALTLSILALRQLPLPATLAGQSWIMRLHDRQAGVPYGVALSVGALVLLPYAEILRRAAGG